MMSLMSSSIMQSLASLHWHCLRHLIFFYCLFADLDQISLIIPLYPILLLWSLMNLLLILLDVQEIVGKWLVFGKFSTIFLCERILLVLGKWKTSVMIWSQLICT